MADLKPFAGLSQEETQYLMLQALVQILDKLPRLDAFDRLIINGSEVSQVTSVTGSLSTVSVIGDLNRINTFGGTAVSAKPADAIPLHLSSTGAAHIYDRIVIS
jgi:hypothetical protein